MQTAITSTLIGVSTLTGSFTSNDPFIQNIYIKVMQTIEKSESVPSKYKVGLVTRLEELLQNGVLDVTGTDEEIRPYFVHLQGIIEHVALP